MVKPVSQQQKEYLKRLKEKKNRWIFGERKEKNEWKGDIVESHRRAQLQWENTKRQIKTLQRVIGRQQVWMLFFELANVKRTFCGFQQSVLR